MSNSNTKQILKGLMSRTKIYLIVIAVLLILISILNVGYLIPAIFVYILVLLYTYWSERKRQNELSEHIQDLTFHVDKAAKNAMIHSPFPLVIVETDGNIVWKSKKFSEEFANIDIKNILNDLVKQIKLEIENNPENPEKDIHKQIEIGTKIYEIYGKYTKNKEKCMLTLYFLDNTESIEVQQDYQDSQICVGIIMVDNFEEVNQRIEDEDKPVLKAKIEKSIYEWAATFEGLVVKSERDTFVCIFEQRYLEQLEERKFRILDTIKELELSDKIQITLSIAVSNEGESNYEKYKSAQAGLDIA